MFLRSFCQTDYLGIDADRFSQVDFIKGVWECAVEGWDFREEGRQAPVSDGARDVKTRVVHAYTWLGSRRVAWGVVL